MDGSDVLFVNVLFLWKNEKLNKSYVLIWSLPSVILLGFFIESIFFAPDMNFWNQKLNIQQYGIAVSFISNIRHMRMDPPKGIFFEGFGDDDFGVCGNRSF